MNVHKRSQVAAIIAVMFLVNFYYFKYWRKVPQSSETYYTSESNHHMKLIKLIVTPRNLSQADCSSLLCNDSGNCSLSSQWSHAVQLTPTYYITDEVAGMASFFVQNPRSSIPHNGTSLQDVNVSIIHIDPGGFVNSEFLLQSASISRFSCKDDTMKTKEEIGGEDDFRYEMEYLIKRILKENRRLKKPTSSTSRKYFNQRHRYLVIFSNCIKHLFDTLEDNIVEVEKHEICTERSSDFQAMFQILSRSNNHPNLLPSRTVIENSTLSEIYYDISNNNSHKKGDRSSSMTLKNMTFPNLKEVEVQKATQNYVSTKNFTNEYGNATTISPKNDDPMTVFPNETKTYSHIINKNNVPSDSPLENIESSRNTTGLPASPTNYQVSHIKNKVSIEQHNENEAYDLMNTTALISEKVRNRESTDQNFEHINFKDNTTKSRSENLLTNKVKGKKGDERRKSKLVGKTNGLDTILVFKNLNEINDLFDKTFSNTEFISSNLASVELLKINTPPLRNKASILEDHVEDKDDSYYNHHGMNRRNFSNAMLTSDRNETLFKTTNSPNEEMTKTTSSVIPLSTKIIVNYTTGEMLSSATENYGTIQGRTTDQELAKDEYIIAIPKELVKSDTMVHNQNDVINLINSNTSEIMQPILDAVQTTTSSHLSLFRSLSRENKTTTLTPVEVIMKRNNTSESRRTNMKSHIIIPSRIRNLTLHETELSLVPNKNGPSIFNGSTDCLETTHRDSIDENTRHLESYLDSTSPNSYTESYIHSTLEKKSKLVDKSEITHNTRDLYDNKPKYKIIRTHANTIGQTHINNYPSADKISHKDVANYAALVSPRYEIPHEFPYFDIPYSGKLSHNEVTHNPIFNEEEYDPDISEMPPTIVTYKPPILSTYTSKEVNTETTNEHNTPQYNDYPENIHSYTDFPENTLGYTHYPQNITAHNRTNNYEEYNEYYDNADPHTEEYQDLTTPKVPKKFENTAQPPPPLRSTIDTLLENGVTVYNDGHENPAYSFDYHSGDNIDTTDSINSGEMTDELNQTKDDDYQDYTDPPNSNNNNNHIIPPTPQTPDNIVYHKSVKPTNFHYFSSETGDDNYHHPKSNIKYEHPQNIPNKPPITHHGFSIGTPNGPVDSVYHKTVEPSRYITSQNFHSKVNQFLKHKFPPDEVITNLFPKSRQKPTAPQTVSVEEYANNNNSGERGQILNQYYQTSTTGPTLNKPLEEITLSPADVIINDFLNSPIDWKEFEQTPQFNFESNVKDTRNLNNLKQAEQSVPGHQNSPPVMNQNVLDTWRNKSVVGQGISYPSNVNDPKTNKLNVYYSPGPPNIVPSIAMGDINSFQPLHLGNVKDPGENSQLKNHFGTLGIIDHFTPAVHINPTHTTIFNVPESSNLKNPNSILGGLYKNSINIQEALSLLRTRKIQPGKISSLFQNNEVHLEQNIPTTNPIMKSFKGIDIFLPNKKRFRSIGKSIDIIKPSIGNSGLLNIIKLKPLQHDSLNPMQQWVDKNPVEIDIITNPSIQVQTAYQNSEYNTPESEIPTIGAEMNNHYQRGYEPIVERHKIPYLGGFQPSYNDNFRPLDLSMLAGHLTPTISYSNKTASFIDISDSEKNSPNSIGELPTRAINSKGLGNTTRNIPEEVNSHVYNWTQPAGISFEKFNSDQEIDLYLKHISHLYGYKVTVFTIGTTVEGRPIQAVKISHGGENNPLVLIDGGIHAREWISPAAVLYVVQQLVEQPQNFPLMRRVDWLLVPLLNPDGYVYSMTKDRMWRKNRARPKPTDGHNCYGVDLNRNFGVFRGRRQIDLDSKGASDDPCANNYRGMSPFSEPESRALRDLIWDHKTRIKLYVSFHSYGQYIMYPWGYKRPLPNDWKELDKLATAAQGAMLNITGTKYSVGSTADIMGMNTGGSDDWVKGYVGVKYCYTIELPGGGPHGFDLPPNRIRPVVSDMFEGIKVFARFVEKEFAD